MGSIHVNKTILVIDRDPDILGYLTLQFEACEVRVLRARTRAEAIEILSLPFVPCDLVLANLMMSRMGGPDFCREVSATRPGVPVVYMSAFVDAGVIRMEAMQQIDESGLGAADERGVLEAVLSTLAKPQTRASGT
jgi:CheY-like chemotaxis protein